MALNPDKEKKLQVQEALKRLENEKDDPRSSHGSKKKRLTREEFLEKKMSMARERGSRVLKINSPLGNIMFNILRQFDQAYGSFKGNLGEPGGITYEEGSEIMAEAQNITVEFSNLTKKLSKKINIRYFVPQELKESGMQEKE